MKTTEELLKEWEVLYEALPHEQKMLIRRFKKGTKFRAGMNGDQNMCPTCAEFFATSNSFDKHRIGKIGKGRRCLTIPEMVEKGYKKNRYFYWSSGGNNPYSKNADSSVA